MVQNAGTASRRDFKRGEVFMFCGNNGWGGNSALWIIILIIILFGWGGNGCGNNCGCNNGCGCNNCGCNNDCGCDNDCGC